MKTDPYRFIARWYDRFFEPLNRKLRLHGLKLVVPKQGMVVLDVGCGTGLYLELLSQYGCALHGIDPSPSMLSVARKKLRHGATLYLGSAHEMPFAAGSFDLVVAMLALHEMNPTTRTFAVGEMRRVLKRDGRILLVDFHPGPIRSLQGWFSKLTITLSEIVAGREHFKNYRQFIAKKGLPPLIAEHGLVIDKQRVVGGGTLALFLVGTG